ncbi:hypothetical protein LO762_01375 [Actinocorallia sp. API 0066]|uniref:hypothetical protein n=1 Tax=Actinocorallia sp. API 0066 TaxID=2896846 RepID=UPI001E5ECDF0|nr:hypothetical protein [Actinocorallia sp. API 0066]MCD0447851.1 hypothetical protein [Actinocorallia sp. API 0066]
MSRLWWVRRSGGASGGDGAIVNTGIQHIHYGGAAGPARTAYSRQVEQIFSGELKDREDELAELAAFCAREEGPEYVWWQAPAWAGKSALMASFVQRPPAGVRVVSFFITARLAGQSDRTAFLSAVLEQLAALTGQPLPDVLTEANRQQWFLQLLEEAAGKCAEDGCRLVLVVDGLDEDRGVRRTSTAHSIAALLPGRPPTNVRIVVAGRPNPPVPSDVPDWHPLHDPRIVRPLPPSPWAVAFRASAERELSDLLDGGGLGRDLLGLLVTSGGGLSTRDLAELTSEPIGEVERILHAVTGRSFTARDPQWHDGAPDRLTLAHEELVQGVQRSLRPTETAAWQARLHTWADTYRARAWPEHTPEYLLRGYLQLLLTLSDTPRITALVTDRPRLNRMLDVSHGDAAAIADTLTAQEHLATHPTPDLSAALHIALTRQHLTERNTHIPTDLPAVWTRLGNVNRALALSRSLPDPRFRVEALAGVVDVLAAAGDTVRAVDLAAEAETSARAVLAAHRRDGALARVAMARTAAGDFTGAERTARSLADPVTRIGALDDVARALASAGDTGRAEAVAAVAEESARTLAPPARPIGDATETPVAPAASGEPEGQGGATPEQEPSGWNARYVEALVAAARSWAVLGAARRASALAREAEPLARALEDGYVRALMLVEVAKVWARAGEAGHAGAVIAEVETVARGLADPASRAWAFRSLASGLAAVGEVHRAATIISTMVEQAAWLATPGDYLDLSLDTAVVALALAGDSQRAEELGRSIPLPETRARSLRGVAYALADAGRAAQAAMLARTIDDARLRAEALSRAATAWLTAGEAGRAADVAADAEEAARACESAQNQAQALTAVAAAWAAVGEDGRAVTAAVEAEAAARSVIDTERQAEVLGDLVTVLVAAGEPGHAHEVAAAVRAIASETGGPGARWDAFLAFAALGDFAEAERTAAALSLPANRASALKVVAAGLAAAGEPEQAERLALTIGYPLARVGAWLAVARAWAAAGQGGHAARAAESAEAAARETASAADVRMAASADYWNGLYALRDAALAWAEAGARERVRAVAAEVETLARAVTDPVKLVKTLLLAAEACVGEPGRAEALLAEASAAARPFYSAPLMSSTLFDLVVAWAERGDLGRAEELARDFDTPDFARVYGLSKVVDALAQAGELTRAEAIARELTDPPVAGWALRSLAERMERADAQRLLATVLVHVKATDLLGSVAAAAPDVLIEAIPHVRALHG